MGRPPARSRCGGSFVGHPAAGTARNGTGGRARQWRARPARLGGFPGGRLVRGVRATGWRRLFLRCGPPDDEELPEMLDGRGAERVADLGEHRVAFGARLPEPPDLDGLV